MNLSYKKQKQRVTKKNINKSNKAIRKSKKNYRNGKKQKIRKSKKSIGGAMHIIHKGNIELDGKVPFNADNIQLDFILNPEIDDQKLNMLRKFKPEITINNNKEHIIIIDNLLSYIIPVENKLCLDPSTKIPLVAIDYIKQDLRKCDMLILAANLDNEIIGFCSLNLYAYTDGPTNLEITTICATFHYSGIGQYIMNEVYKIANIFKSYEITLDSIFNLSTISFYSNNNFNLFIDNYDYEKLLTKSKSIKDKFVNLLKLNLFDQLNIFPHGKDRVYPLVKFPVNHIFKKNYNNLSTASKIHFNGIQNNIFLSTSSSSSLSTSTLKPSTSLSSSSASKPLASSRPQRLRTPNSNNEQWERLNFITSKRTNQIRSNLLSQSSSRKKQRTSSSSSSSRIDHEAQPQQLLRQQPLPQQPLPRVHPQEVFEISDDEQPSPKVHPQEVFEISDDEQPPQPIHQPPGVLIDLTKHDTTI